MPAAPAPAIDTSAPPDLHPRAYARATRRILVCLVAVGLAVRIARALLPTAVWGDEAMVALNLAARDYAGLLQPLDHGQVAPLLFLWGERLAIVAFGSAEWSLRLFPLIASVLGLLLYWDFARRTVPPTAAALAVGFMAVAVWPVSMAGTIKPYASDLFWSSLLLALAARWHCRPERIWPLAALVVAVPFALVGSYPAVFVAGAVAVYLLPVAWRARGVARALYMGYAAAMFAAFAATYFLIAQTQLGPAAGSTGEYMRWYWRDGFPPDSAWGIPLWLLDAHTGRAFAYPAGDSSSGSLATTLLFAAGVVWCWRNGSRPLLALCLVPFALNLVAAAMGKYPYAACCRLSQHLAPAICLLAGAGAAAAMERWAPRRADLLVVLRGAAALLIVFAVVSVALKCLNPDRDAVSAFSRNLHRELAAEIAPGDKLAVLAQPGTDITLVWYLSRFGEQVVWLAPGDTLPDAERLWVVTTHGEVARRTIHQKLIASAPGWSKCPTIWYACRPDDFRHGKGLWWHVGVTCLTRRGDTRPAPLLNAVP